MGQYVYTAMRNLDKAGYCFSEASIIEMTTPEWTYATFHTTSPFMKISVNGEIDTKGADGEPRFKAELFKFGDYQVLISKEWKKYHLQYFKDWYNKL